jgi:opacity protein-like surface antigen
MLQSPQGEERVFPRPQEYLGHGEGPSDYTRPENASWLARPVSIGLFVGMLTGSPLIDDWVGQSTGYLGGIRFGYDFDEYFGTEFRAGLGSTPLYDSARAQATLNEVFTADGVPANSPQRQLLQRNSDRSVYDISLLYYYCGDRRLRPYFLAGIGFAQLRFSDILGNGYSNSMYGIPLALGLKYHVDDRMALRFEVGDDILFAGGMGMNVLHDVTVSAGLELRFGGHPKSYWPWNPGANFW